MPFGLSSFRLPGAAWAAIVRQLEREIVVHIEIGANYCERVVSNLTMHCMQFYVSCSV